MASKLIDYTRLQNALSAFKTNILSKAKPFHVIVTYQNLSILATGGTVVTITSTDAGIDLSSVTILGVSIQDAWPQESWANGAMVSVLNYGMSNGNLLVSLTTNSAQHYRFGIDIICVNN